MADKKQILLQDDTNKEEKKVNLITVPKKKKYALEQKEIFDKLLVILGISNKNKTFYEQDIHESVEKQNQIKALEPNIRKYFSCSHWQIYLKKNNDLVNLVKSLLKNMGVKLNIIYIKDESNRLIQRKGYLMTY